MVKKLIWVLNMIQGNTAMQSSRHAGSYQYKWQVYNSSTVTNPVLSNFTLKQFQICIFIPHMMRSPIFAILNIVKLNYCKTENNPRHLVCHTKEKWRNWKFFVNRVHWATRMFRVYSIIMLLWKCRCQANSIAKSGKTKWHNLLFLKKKTKQITRISIKVDETQLFCLVFQWNTTKLPSRISDLLRW